MFSKYYSGAVACTLAVTCFVSVPVWAKVSAEAVSYTHLTLPTILLV